MAVPGQVYGFYELWKQAGSLPWADLFQPAIKLAREGFRINGALAFAIKRFEDKKFYDDEYR